MIKPDFSNGLHTNGILDYEKVFLYDKIKEQEKRKKKQEQKEQRPPRFNLTK